MKKGDEIVFRYNCWYCGEVTYTRNEIRAIYGYPPVEEDD